MKKLSLLLLVAVYFCFVQTAVAQTINANGVDPANAVWYVIKNNGTGEYLRFDGKRFPMSTNEGTFSGGGSTAIGLDTYNMFYFAYGAGDNSGKVYMHTYESELLCAAPDLWTAAGAEIAINAQGAGHNIFIEGGALHWNSDEGITDFYLATDENSVWVLEQITDFGPITGLDALAQEAQEVCDGMDFRWLLAHLSLTNAGKWWNVLVDYGPQVEDILNNNHASLESAQTDYETVEKILADLTDLYAEIISYNYVNIYTTDNSGYLSTNTTSLTINEYEYTHTVVWKLVSTPNNSYYIYNEASNQYVGIPDRESGEVKLVSDINLAGEWKLNLNETSGGVTTATIQSRDWTSGYLYHQADAKNVVCATTATTWFIKSTADVVISDALYYLAANAAWQYPYTLQQMVGLVQNGCEAYYSNAPSGDEGSSTCNLMDGVYTTSFWTTAEGNESEEYHYLEADLGEGNEVSEFFYYLKTNFQRTDGRPVTISVLCSNDGTSYTGAGSQTTNLANEMYYFSTLVESGDGNKYRYWRFVVESVNVNMNGSPKEFTLSEFYMLPNTADVSGCYDKIYNFYHTSLAGNGIIAPALELVKMEAEYYLNNSKHSNNPAVGEYLTTAYNDLQAAYNSVTTETATIEALAVAIEKFKNSKCRPVFMITSAWESGFSNGWAVNYDVDAATFNAADTNIWDLRQWFAHGDLDSEVLVPASSIELKSLVGNQLIMGAQHSIIEAIDGWNTLYESALDAYNLRLYNASNYMTVDKYMALATQDTPATTTANQNAAWYFTYVGTSAVLYGFDVSNEAHIDFVEALAGFGEVFEKAQHYYTHYDATGTKLGEYHYDNKGLNSLVYNGFEAEYNDALAIYELGVAGVARAFLDGNNSYNATALNTLKANLEAHFPNFHLNNPPTGYYYRLRGYASGNYLMTDVYSGGGLQMGALVSDGVVDENVELKSILYALPSSNAGAAHMLSFDSGRYLSVGTVPEYDEIPVNDQAVEDDWCEYVEVHSSSTGAENYFSLAFEGADYLLDNYVSVSSTKDFRVNRSLDWTIELVRELPVHFGTAKMATFFAPKEVVIPEGVRAYILTGRLVADGFANRDVVDGSVWEEGTELFQLEQIEGGVIPAGTPVLLVSESAGVYRFAINYTPTAADDYVASLAGANLLKGYIDARYVEESTENVYYILANKPEIAGVGMYKVALKGAGTRGDAAGSLSKSNFLVKGHRAWLPLPQEMVSMAIGYSFGTGGNDGATDIEEVKGENGNVKAIYDLHGRKLERIERPGIYVVNGRTVLIK